MFVTGSLLVSLLHFIHD